MDNSKFSYVPPRPRYRILYVYYTDSEGKQRSLEVKAYGL